MSLGVTPMFFPSLTIYALAVSYGFAVEKQFPRDPPNPTGDADGCRPAPSARSRAIKRLSQEQAQLICLDIRIQPQIDYNSPILHAQPCSHKLSPAGEVKNIVSYLQQGFSCAIVTDVWRKQQQSGGSDEGARSHGRRV